MPGTNKHDRARQARSSSSTSQEGGATSTCRSTSRGRQFEESVWGELRRIPYGETRSYEDLARAVGRPGGSRAVGQANGRNRIAIVIPCHRVVNKGGELGGYGGGLWRKRFLLDLEQRNSGLFAAS